MSRPVRRTVTIAAACAVLVLLLALAVAPALAAEPWGFTQVTSPSTQSLTAGTALDANHVWAAGGQANIVFWDGTSWTSQNSGGSIFLGGMCAGDATHVWAGGDNQTILRLTGTTWGPEPGWVGTTGVSFYAADALDASNAWMAGGTSSACSIVNYNGTNWTEEAPAGVTDQIKAVSALDADHVWAAGYDASNNSHIYFRGAGHTWSSTPQYTLTGVRLRGICAISPTNVWAVGNAGTILHYDGTNWTADPQSGVVVTTDQYMVNATAANNVWSAGSGNTAINFDGATWTNYASPVGAAAHRTALPTGPGSVWLTGQGGRIFEGSIMRIDSCSPNSGAQTQTVDVNIVGIATHFVNTTSAATFSGAGITVNSTTVTDPTHATANITIAAGAAPGARDVNVTTGAETPTASAGGFTVKAMHTITATAGPNGTITPADAVKVIDGDSQAFTVTPRAGYYVQDVVIDSSIHLGNVKGYTFNGVTTDRTISAVFGLGSPIWYLPEGSTAWGFGASINIENPNNQDLNAKVTYMLTNGKTKELMVGLPKMSQVTVAPFDTVGEADFSTKVECVQGKSIAVDRTMAWSSGAQQGAGIHNSIGVTAPTTTWFLPEGSSNWGFETWLLIQNPNADAATCHVVYMVEGIGPKVVDHVVPAHSRASFNMLSEIGKADASIMVLSDMGVIPERSMYTHWVIPGGQDARREGHDSIGTASPANDFYLAEGSTAWGFTTYVLIQNPNATKANVTLTYMTNSGPVSDPTFSMPPNSRKTVRVNDKHPGLDLSTKVHSDKPIVAERSMFWSSVAGMGQATHDSIGTSSAHADWYLPDGEVTPGDGTETYTLVQNPNTTPVTVRVSYLNQGGKNNVVFTDIVGAYSRKTYNMADKYAPETSASASIMVESLTSGKNIIVERSMYINARWGGSDTIGGCSD